MKRTHVIIGLGLVVIFLFTGMYMDLQQPPVREMSDTTRMMFRSRHIYILLTGLLNLAIGTYFISQVKIWRRVLQFIGSTFIIAASSMIVAAFFYESWWAGLPRPLTLPAMILILTGTLAHWMSGIRANES